MATQSATDPDALSGVLMRPTAPNPSIWTRFVPMQFHARGGLGEVLVAQDTELNRPVALKRILGEVAGDPEAHRRFLLEAEITGRLEHPGVVPVYGLGVDPQTGRPGYAMRFISGRPLKTVIEEFHRSRAHFDSLTFRKLLSRFVSVCQTIGFAHSKGVLHRDVKPSNIMVGAHGETLVVDWGLAKVLGEPSVDSSSTVSRSVGPSGPLLANRPRGRSGTGSGAATVEGAGTPGYMAPEQAAGEVDKLGPAADIYGLGATLYHLLTGQGPLERESTLAMMSRTLTGEVPTARATKAGVPTALDAVCRKAMALDPRCRYGSAEELAADLEAWLADEPVSCLREGSVALAQRWMRRNPAVVATSLAVVIVLGFGAVAVAGLVNAQRSALSSKSLQISAERDRALEAERTAQEQRDRAREAEQAAQKERDRAVAAERRAAANFEEARQVVRECLDMARDHPVFHKAGMQEARELLLRAAAPFHERFASVGGTRELQHEAVVAKYRAALQAAETKSKPEALALLRQCVDQLRDLTARHPKEVVYRADLARSQSVLATLLKETGDLSGADQHYRTALALRRELVADFPDNLEHKAELALTLSNYSLLLLAQNDAAGAERQQRAAMELRKALHEQNPKSARYRSELSLSHGHLGRMACERGDLTAAEREYRAALALQTELLKQYPNSARYRDQLARTRYDLGYLFKEAGKRDEAEREYLVARELQKQLLEENPAVLEYQADLANIHNSLGVLYRTSGSLADAEREFRASLALRTTLAEQNPTVVRYRRDRAFSHHNLGRLLLDKGDAKAAVAEQSAALRLRRELLDASPESVELQENVAESHIELARARDRADDAAGAEREYRAAIALRLRLSEAHPTVLRHQRELGMCYNNVSALSRRMGQLEAARVAGQRAVDLMIRVVEKAPTVTDYRQALSRSRAVLAAALASSDAPAAMDQLRLSGSYMRSFVQKDSAFDPLRSRADFQALLADWQKSTASDPSP